MNPRYFCFLPAAAAVTAASAGALAPEVAYVTVTPYVVVCRRRAS